MQSNLFLAAIILAVFLPNLVNAQSQQLQIRGTTQIIEGRKLIRPDKNSLLALSEYRKQFEPEISKFPEMKYASVKKLKISLSTPALATVDNYWSNSEQVNPNIPPNYYITGSVSCSGQNKAIAPKAGQALAYLELTNGQRWMSGDQKVDGGCGILKSVNGGKEPAGRLVWGTDALKIVLTGVDEQREVATFNAYLRICASLPLGKTCTPYFIPIPWFSVQGQNWIAIGGGLL